MSLLTQAYLIEKYGPRLSMKQLAEVLGITVNTLYNQRTSGTLAVPTYEDGQRWADYRDVAKHLDDCRARATVPA